MDYTLDAKNKPLGRLASEIATILQGKKHAAYEPRLLGTDRVIVKNADKVVLTGRKPAQKVYYKHTGKLGHLKETKFKDAFAKNPKWVLQHAVNLMLPKNKLRAKRMRQLIFE